MVIASSSIGLALHPSNLTASGSQSFAGTRGDSKGRSPWRAFGDFPRDGKVTRGGGAERPYMGRSAEDGAQPLLALGKGSRFLKLLYPFQREKTTAFSRRWAVEKETAAAVKKKEQKKEQLLDTGKNRKTAPKTMLIALLYQPCRQKSSLFSKFFHPSSPMRQNPLCGNPGETGGEFL